MTTRVYETTFLVPAGTPVAAPVTQAVPLEDNILDVVTIIVPDGHAGLTGFHILWGGTQILPYNAPSWLIANNEKIEWPYASEVTAAGLSVAGYNTDIWPHTFYVRWQVSEIGRANSSIVIESPQAVPPAPADIAAILNLSGAV